MFKLNPFAMPQTPPIIGFYTLAYFRHNALHQIEQLRSEHRAKPKPPTSSGRKHHSAPEAEVPPTAPIGSTDVE